MTGERTRRGVLGALGAALAGALAGCDGDGEQTGPGTRTTTSATADAETTTARSTPTEQQTKTSDVFPATDIQEPGSLNLKPADPSAEYAESIVYDQFNGNVDVELDLQQARDQRFNAIPERAWGTDLDRVNEFIEKVDDSEWRSNFIEEHADVGFSVDWDTYTDESLSYDERMVQSNMTTFWYLFERERLGGISSTNNQFKAGALQGLEDKAGFDTFVWDYHIDPAHGLVSTIENPTRNPEETSEQEVYIVETDWSDTPQVATWDNSPYSEDRDQHPAREDIEQNEKGLYAGTSIAAWEGDIFESVEVSDARLDSFEEFFRNPGSEPAFDLLEPMAAAAYIAEENAVNDSGEGTVILEEDELRYEI